MFWWILFFQCYNHHHFVFLTKPLLATNILCKNVWWIMYLQCHHHNESLMHVSFIAGWSLKRSYWKTLKHYMAWHAFSPSLWFFFFFFSWTKWIWAWHMRSYLFMEGCVRFSAVVLCQCFRLVLQSHVQKVKVSTIFMSYVISLQTLSDLFCVVVSCVTTK